ncbi:LOG family protein [Georgenia halophila]|uniref:LOG family protein n=1 Tax=Georgenia halophila TaxID=620889 RepID=A0ABP8LJF4_9MICO
MSKRLGSTVEVESVEEFDTRIADGAIDLSGWHLQGLDLRGRGHALRSVEVAGALFLDCELDPGDEVSIQARGALVFPAVPGVPVDSYRATLYDAEELYEGMDASYEATLDARVYAWSQQERSLDLTLTKALHDHSIDDALLAAVEGRRVVGVMGGHALVRGSVEYAAAARLAAELTRAGLTVATGGGPGAMEAANLGAYLAHRSPGNLEEALEMLAAVPSFAPSVRAWARAAFDVRERWPDGAESLGVPTWHYGHEPPNAFATQVAKYFRNAVREAVLLRVATAGIVFLPGAAGTTQEVFQDACENYYADASSVAPMVLVGREHWTERLPVWPLLTALAGDRLMASHVHLVEDVDEVPSILGGHGESAR